MQVEPAQALNIPAIPVGPLLATIYPLASYPPYVLSWLNSQILAQDMMDQKLFEKLVLNNFGKFQFIFHQALFFNFLCRVFNYIMHFSKRIIYETVHSTENCTNLAIRNTNQLLRHLLKGKRKTKTKLKVKNN